MRHITTNHVLSTLVVAGGVFWLSGNVAQAQSATHVYRYCGEIAPPDSGWGCSYETWDQCMETMRGEGGFCRENPRVEMNESSSRTAHH